MYLKSVDHLMFSNLILLLFVLKLFNDARTSSFLLLDAGRWEKMFNKVQTSCFANTQRYIIATSTFWIATFDDFIGESRNAHPPFYPLPALPRRKKGGSRSLSFPLKISWFFSAFGLLEVALQHTLERLAVAGLVWWQFSDCVSQTLSGVSIQNLDF